MAKARTIRKRAKAVKSIRTITRTMEMVASALYAKAHAQAAAARPHTERLRDLVGDALARSGGGELDHPLLKAPDGVKREVLMVLTSNRGMCGGYNASVLRVALERRAQLIEAGYETQLWVAGRRGTRYLRFLGLEIDRPLTELGFLPDHHQTGQVAHELMDLFLAGEIGGLEVAYMQYVPGTRQSPAISQILPMEFIEPPKTFIPAPGDPLPYEFLPSAAEVLRHLLPATARLRLWQCFLDAGLGEQAMRIGAMKAATENADDMIHDLTVAYNHTRQAQITYELAEIMGGRIGLE